MKKMVLDLRFFLVTLAMLLVAAGTFSLGEWQLRRAQKKLDLQTAIEERKSLQALDVQAISATNNIADFVHRPAALQGKWRGENTVFLDNRPMGGKTGFIVVTPLALNGSAQVILVQRGWVARSFTERTSLPEIVTPGGLVTVNGRIAPPPSKLYEFKGIEVGRIRQNLDVTVFSAEVGSALLPVSLLQTGPSSEGLLRDWAAPNTGLEKHYGYAFQWFALCALVVGLYVWFQLINPFRVKKSLVP